MSSGTVTNNEFTYLTIPDRYVCIYQRLLYYLIDNGIDIITGCPNDCKPRDKRIIICWNIFQSACAAYTLGDTKKAELFIKYIEGQLNIDNVEECGDYIKVKFRAYNALTGKEISDYDLFINGEKYVEHQSLFKVGTSLIVKATKFNFNDITLTYVVESTGICNITLVESSIIYGYATFRIYDSDTNKEIQGANIAINNENYISPARVKLQLNEYYNFTVTKSGYSSFTPPTLLKIASDTLVDIELSKTESITKIINVNVIGANLTIDGVSYGSSYPVSITKPKNTVVNIIATKTGYITFNQNITFTDSSTYTVNLQEVPTETVTIDVQLLTSGGTLIVNGETISTNHYTATVNKGSNLSWSASKTGYITQTYSGTINSNYSVQITLVAQTDKTRTISCNVEGATVILDGSSVTLPVTLTKPYGTSVSYTASKTGYDTKTGTIIFNTNDNFIIELIATGSITLSPTTLTFGNERSLNVINVITSESTSWTLESSATN